MPSTSTQPPSKPASKAGPGTDPIPASEAAAPAKHSNAAAEVKPEPTLLTAAHPADAARFEHYATSLRLHGGRSADRSRPQPATRAA